MFVDFDSVCVVLVGKLCVIFLCIVVECWVLLVLFLFLVCYL